MGWLAFGAAQVALTSITLGWLQESGVISVDPRRITNPQARAVFEGCLEFGTSVSSRAGQVFHSLVGGK